MVGKMVGLVRFNLTRRRFSLERLPGKVKKLQFMLYLVIRLVLLIACAAGSVRIVQVMPATKITVMGDMLAVAIFGVMIAVMSYRGLVEEFRKHPEKKWQAPFWLSSFYEAPVSWYMTGILCAGTSTVVTFIYAAMSGGGSSFGFIFLGITLGYICGILAFKRTLPNQPTK